MAKKNFYNFSVKTAKGGELSLDKYTGRPVLVVNVASRCGYTPQYTGLEALYQEFKDEGLEILGFPCNQFGAQEPGTDDEIQSFCQLNHGVTFPVLAKIDVNGSDADPLYKWLKSSARGLLGTKLIKWNFTKFLIGKDGQVLKRYAPSKEPKALAKDIKKAL